MRFVAPFAFALALSACSSAPPRSSTASVAEAAPASPSTVSAAPPRSPAFTLVDQMTLDARHLREMVVALSLSKDPEAIVAGGEKLVAIARATEAQSWRDAHRHELATADAASHLAPTPQQFEEQLSQWQSEEVARTLAWMAQLGGDEPKRYAFEVAARADADPKLRRAAIDALGALVDPAVGDEVEQRAALEVEVARIEAERDQRAHPVSDAANVLAKMRPGFRRCYSAELARDPSADAKLRVKATIDKNGDVSSVALEGNGATALRLCVEALVKKAHFAAPEGGSATILIPVVFDAG